MSAGDDNYVDAEAWLAAKGVERRTLVDLSVPDPDVPAGADGQDGAVDDGRPAVSMTEATRLATETVPSTPVEQDAATPLPPLGEAVSEALATVRRITGAAPASEGRIQRKLEERDLPAVVIDETLVRARSEGLVDDDALAAALVAEWRAKGHAPLRLRQDLRAREFDDAVIARATAVAEQDDAGAAAFGLARERAERLRHLEPETAYRRTAAFLSRRGYTDGLSRKAARDAVYDDRERERTAGR